MTKQRLGLAKQIVILLLIAFVQVAPGADQESAAESKVKALFILNFAKYVEWPESAFESEKAPIVIGIVGKNHFGIELQKATEEKPVNHRGFVIRHLSPDDNLQGCQILFVSSSEAGHVREILEKTSALPVLTVGEDRAFSDNGGVIDMESKNGRIQLRINLAAADKAGLKISSKLLAVADEVKSKQ